MSTSVDPPPAVRGRGRPPLPVRAPLTEKQQAVWDLKCAGKSVKEIAADRGVSVPVVWKTLNIVRKKLGIVDARGLGQEQKRIENIEPDKAAVLVDAVTEPDVRGKLRRISDAIKESGLPERFGKAILKRLETRYLNVKTEIRSLKTSEILAMIGEKIHLAGQYLDDHSMAEASARDLMLGMSALVEKRQLLRGEPTQIVSDFERKRLNELLPLLSMEMQRRGITFDGRLIEKTVHVEPANPPA